MQCELCLTDRQQDLMTKCCKLFICQNCKDKYEQAAICACGKAVSKKLCTANTAIYNIIHSFYENEPPQCDRCEKDAEIECRNCDLIFCCQCNTQVHNGKGFMKHIRQPYAQKSPRKRMEKIKKRDEVCASHLQIYQAICQCGAMLCQNCLKNHRESCKTYKIKPLKQHKQQFFTQILLKIKQIIEYKDKLMEEKKSYQEHFMQQKNVFLNYSKTMDEQLEGLKKILQIKSVQIKQKLQNYWRTCETNYHKKLFIFKHHLKKFDDYAKLSQKFVEKITGLQYLERRIKKITVAYDFFNFRVNNTDDVQNSIINIGSTCKQWEDQQSIITANFQQQKPKQKILDLLGNIASNPDFLLQCSQKPLNHRPLTLTACHNEVHFQFLHLPYHQQTYQLEYGVGLKMKGQEVFKRIKNNNGSGKITNLNPSTKYRVRMRVSGGEWGPISEVKTQQIPKFLFQNYQLKHSHEHSQHSHMLKPGVVYGSNEISFGIHTWEIKISPMKHLQQQTACISLGVSNKQTKKPIFVGTTLNYGYQKQQITVRLILNCEQNKLVITSTSANQDEVYQNLPNYPIYPMLQNKGNHPVQIQYSFV